MKKEEKLIILIVSIIAVLSLLVVSDSISGKYAYNAGQVKITVSTSGKGYVTSYPSGIECGYACSESYSSGTQISLTAKSLGDAFSGWGGDCSGSSATCTLILDRDNSVSANFGSAQPVVSQPRTVEKIRSYGNIVPADHQYPSACDDYPTMPGCPGEGTNIAPIMPVVPDVTITGFEPKKGYERTVVNIKGTNLGYVSKVFFNGELVEGWSVTPDGKELQTIVPQGAETGPIELLLTSGGLESSSQDFVVWTGKCSNPDVTKAFNQLNKLPKGQKNEDECNPAKYLRVYSNYKELRNAIQKVVGFSKLSPPKIKYFNPSIVMPGQEVSIIGERFDVYADEIKFDGKTVPFKLIDDREIKIKIPEGAVFGDHEIKIVSDIHGAGSAKIKVIPLPGITNFNPKKVWLNEEITISGENFYEVQEISFFETSSKKEILTKNFKASLEQIKVNAPQAPGSYIITVKAKNSYAKTQTALKVEAKPLPPEIASIEPEDGRLGNSAIINGKNLNSVTSITLNGYRLNYENDNSDTQKTIYVSWGIDQGVVKVTTPGGSAQAELLSNKNPVTKLITGKEETCFGGVGKGCYGSEDNKEEWGWGSQKIVAPVGCSNEVNGKRNCWVVPGSIKHDNCCARYPSGKMCGGPGKDKQPAGESNHDGHCVSEWDAAFWDVFWWRAFVATFDASKPTDLTPKSSSRYVLKDSEGNNILSETSETLRLCAPDGHELREQYDEKFCCSGKAVNKKCASGRGVQALPIVDDVVRTDKGADLSTVPIPLAPGEVAKPKPPKDEPAPPKEDPKPAPITEPSPPKKEEPIVQPPKEEPKPIPPPEVKPKPQPRPPRRWWDRPICIGRYCLPRLVRG